MSRERPYEYSVTLDPATVARIEATSGWSWPDYEFDEMDALVYAVEKSAPRRNYGFGMGTSGVVSYTLYANRTKARQIAARLDAMLDTRGTLVLCE